MHCLRSLVFVFGIFVFTLALSPFTYSAAVDEVEPSVYACEMISESVDQLSLSVRLSEFNSEQVDIAGETYNQISIENEVFSTQKGYPQLPSIRRLVLMPPCSGVSVDITRLESHIVHGFMPIPFQGLSNDSIASQTTFSDTKAHLIKDNTIYNQAQPYPENPVEIGTPAIMRGYRILPVTVYPFRWDPQSRDLEVIDHIEFNLDFNSDENRTNLVENPERNRYSKNVHQMVSNLVINPPEPERDLGTRNGSVVYVIKQWDDVEEALQPLMEWRRQMGWTVEIIRCIDDADAQAIKEEIQVAYDEWETPPEMVIIVGDTDGDFPMGFWDHGTGHYPYESDHDYVMLEGDDVVPDAAVGRFPISNINMLEDIVNKIITYESEPYIGEGDEVNWQKRGAVIDDDERVGLAAIDLCNWVKINALRNGFEEVFEHDPDDPLRIPDVFDAGITFLLHRGWTFLNGFHHREVPNLRNHEMLPFVLMATCNSGDFAEHIANHAYFSELFLTHDRGGAIGAIGASGAVHSSWANLYSAGVFASLLVNNNPYAGWALMNGKLELFRHYADRDDIDHEENHGVESWLMHAMIFNLIGDPATSLFTDAPHQIEVTCPEVLAVEDSHVQVLVEFVNEPIDSEITVCLYKNEDHQLVGHPDENGLVNFDFDPQGWTDEAGEIIYLTVTGRNIMSNQFELEVMEGEAHIGASDFEIDDDDEGESNGDGDGIANPTEIIELSVEVTNFNGDLPEGEVTFELTTLHPNLEVVQGQARLDWVPDEGESEIVNFVIEIGGGFAIDEQAVFNLQTTIGEESWASSVIIEVAGARYELVEILWEEELEQGGASDVSFVIANTGGKDGLELQATLATENPFVAFPVPEGGYRAIAVDNQRQSIEPFRVAVANMFMPGNQVEMELVLTDEIGLENQIPISFQVSQAGEGTPTGPDNYGYYCLDDTDEDWFVFPEFDWIEICPNADDPDFEGTDTGLEDEREEQDESVIINLPFDFVYYGQEFTEITISTNGWMAMGDCEELVLPVNRMMPGAGNAPGMIAPFWDDLLTTGDGGVYYHYDEENEIFIVEWYEVQRLVPGDDGATETFQVLLYNPEAYPTPSGDGDFTFQYLEAVDEEDAFRTWDVPYATIGICSPDQREGMTYTYWNELANGAAPIENERAIKFTTFIPQYTATIQGHVTDAETNEPIEGALISNAYDVAVFTFTDEEGFYELEVLSFVPVSIVASALGYERQQTEDIVFEANEERELNFELSRPALELDVDNIQQLVNENEIEEIVLRLSNNGNGDAEWRAEFISGDVPHYAEWELQESIPIGEITGDSRLQGAVFIDDLWYIAGSNDRDPLIYVLNRDREVVEEFHQPGEAVYGMKDLAWDGELIWGSGENQTYGIDTDGDLVTQFEGPYNPNNNFAYDPFNEWLWVSATPTDIVGIDRQGNEQEIIDRQDLRLYGLGYLPNDRDECCLYTVNYDSDLEPSHQIYKFNTETGEMLFVSGLEIADGRITGLEFSDDYIPLSWSAIVTINDGAADYVNVYHVSKIHDFIELNPSHGILEAQDEQDITMTIRPLAVDVDHVDGEIIIYQNDVEAEIEIPVSIEIEREEEVHQQVISLVEGWNMMSINISPLQEFWAEDEDRGPDVVRMLDQLRIGNDDHHVRIFKNDQGEFYHPGRGANFIDYWSLIDGYQICVDEDVQCTWSGERIDAGADIPLREGWNIVPYYPEYTLDASEPDFYVLSSIDDHLLWAKDWRGRFISPAFNFSNMLDWQPGQGYLVKVDEECMLNYPARRDENAIAVVNTTPQVLPALKITGENMSVLVDNMSSFEDNCQVIARDSRGQIVGAGGVRNSRCGFAVWGDDPETDVKDGLIAGEAFTLVINDESSIEQPLKPSKILTGKLVYETNGFLALEAGVASTVPDRYYLAQNYPNPFNGKTRISFGLPEDANVVVSVFDTNGRLVETIASGKLTAGMHTMTWDANASAAGIYLIRMTGEGKTFVRKAVLVR